MPMEDIIKEGVFFDLTDLRAQLEFHGADRQRFLQGQVSNDVRLATSTQSVYCAVMSSKGKMNGDGFIHDGGNFLAFDTESNLRDPLRERFERFIIADDVEIQDVTGQKCLIHLIGGESKWHGFGLPLVESWRTGVKGHDIFAPATAKGEILSRLSSAQIARGENGLFETLRIEQGIARYGVDMDEDTIPNEAGLESRAISYHKGCYIGQEVISRIKSVGRVNWCWSGFDIDRDSPLTAESKIILNEKEIGFITSSCYSETLSRVIGLGYLRRGHENEGQKYTTDGGVTVTVARLPFIRWNI